MYKEYVLFISVSTVYASFYCEPSSAGFIAEKIGCFYHRNKIAEWTIETI